MIFGLSVYLFIRISIVSKKLDRLIRDIDDTQNWIRRIQIDIWTSLLPSSTGGRHGA